MQLKTRVMAKPSSVLQKQLLCCFDHQVDLALQQNYDTKSNTASEQIIQHILDCYYSHPNKLQCVIVYKLSLNLPYLKSIIYGQDNDLNWSSMIYQYDAKTKKIEEKQCLSQSKQENKIDEEWQKVKKNQENTFIVDLVNNRQELIRIYYLPFSKEQQKQETQVTRARHENFKLFKIIKEYVSLQCNCDTPLVFQETIFNNLASFLYLDDVYCIQIIIWLEETTFDHSLLKQIGEIKVPEPWLQKPEYRRKKKQMYQLKTKEYYLISGVKKQKQQFVENIEPVQQIIGLSLQSYNDITLQTFKKIRHQSLIEKTAEIKELQIVFTNLQTRLMNLDKKKEEYLTKKVDSQKKHIRDILQLKQEISLFQQQQLNRTSSQNNFSLIYSRVNKLSESKSTTKTTFVSGNKKNGHKMQPSDLHQYADMRESEKTEKNIAPVLKRTQFKNNEKKVASVVKGTNPSLKINTRQLREDYEAQIQKIDFQMEKKYVQMLTKYEKAGQQLNKVRDNSDEIFI